MAEEIDCKRKLNGVAEDLGAVIGLTKTLLLCATLGGTKLYVPDAARPDHRLFKLLGESAFRRLVAEWGCAHLNVPALADFGRYQRIRKAAEMHARGNSLHAIAAATGVTYQQAKNDLRTAENLGIVPLVLTGDRKVKSDAEVIRQMGFEGF